MSCKLTEKNMIPEKIYFKIFPKVPNLDEESLGKIVLVSFLLKCK